MGWSNDWSEAAIGLSHSSRAGAAVGSRAGLVSGQSQRLENLLSFHAAKFKKSSGSGFPLWAVPQSRPDARYGVVRDHFIESEAHPLGLGALVPQRLISGADSAIKNR